jgi:hypothetical protein
MLRRSGSIALLAVVLIAAPRALRAQEVVTAPTLAPTALPAVTDTPAEQPAVVSDAPVVTERAAGPTLDGATVGFRHTTQTTQSTHAPVTVAAARGSNSAALMIVGGAAFLAGAIIGDDAGTIIMVGGAAVGLYGLYLYLQ